MSTSRFRILLLVGLGLGGMVGLSVVACPKRVAEARRSPAPSMRPGWLAEAQEQIRREEKKATLQEMDGQGVPFEHARWHLVHREAGIRAYLDEKGVEFAERENGAWRVRMALEEPAAEEVEGMECRIRARRGRVEELLENREKGVEHSFVVREGPADLTMAVEMEGVEVSVATEDRVVFATGEREVMEYRDLTVLDADGKKLASRMEWSIGRLTLRVLEEGRYPILVDPLATSAAWTAESNQTEAHFGSSVATAGDVNGDGFSDVILGAPDYDNGQTDEGMAFVYYGSTSGLSATANWTAESNQADAEFGSTVATAGDVDGDGNSDVIVGAPGYDVRQITDTRVDTGRAFVYLGSAAGLSAATAWSAEGTQESESFGSSVAAAGDVNGDGYSDVIIGAPYYGNGETGEGRAVVHHGSASGLSTTANWTAEGDQFWAYFGASVSTAGDVNGDGYADGVVGAHAYGTGQERACVYHGSAAGLSTAADWTAVGDQPGSDFGFSVSTAGDVNGDGYADVIVGAYYYDYGQTDEGRAFVYHGSASGLSTSANWTAEIDQDYAYFGRSVASAGDVNGDGYADVIIGAYWYDNGQSDEGGAFVYHGSASGLPAAANWTGEGGQSGAHFGYSVAPAGDVDGDGFGDVLVGAPDFNNSETDEGRAFLYLGSGGGLSTMANWTAEGDQEGAGFGASVSSAGDVNGDGYSDVIVGAYDFDNGQTREGRAFVYYGSGSGLSASADWTAEGNQAEAHFGWSVSTAGDVNGDGYSDVIVGAYVYDVRVFRGRMLTTLDAAGRAFVFQGSAVGLSTSADWTAESDQEWAFFGYSVASAGDVNGDGYSDVIVGAPQYDNGEEDEGRVFVYFGSTSGLSTSVDWTAESDQAASLFGRSVAFAGDVNRDGFSDVLVGAPSYEYTVTGQGAAFVYHGSSTGLSTRASGRVVGSTEGAFFGWSVSAAGDVNGDGYSDVIIGAPYHDNEESLVGGAYVYLGSIRGISGPAAWTVEGEQAGEQLGGSVSTAGDVNGDSFSDIIVGAQGYENGQNHEGGAFVYHGSASGLSTTVAWTAESDQAWASFGHSVSTAGDVNGDGYSDVIVGSPDRADDGTAVGQAWLYYGNEGSGLSVRPRQAYSDGTRKPMQLLARSSNTAFMVQLFGRSPWGRTRVRLQVEAQPIGSEFTGTGLTTGSWTDIGVAGTELEQSMSGLSANTAYHWRARLQSFPYMTYGPWFSIGPNGSLETDLRTFRSVWR